MMKQLYLVRHAKSSWSDTNLSDIQRPLNKRGLRNAPEMGRRLKISNVKPQLIISSPAKRAVLTAQFLAKAIDYETHHIVQDDRLYFEGHSSMLDIIRRTRATIHSLMLVGHNPEMTLWLNQLCGFQTDNMPTCAIASIQFDQKWCNVCNNSGFLNNYDFPKKPF